MTDNNSLALTIAAEHAIALARFGEQTKDALAMVAEELRALIAITTDVVAPPHQEQAKRDMLALYGEQAELLEAACSLLKNGLVTDTQAVAEFKDMLTVRVDETIATERARNLAQAFQKRIIAEAR